MYHGHTILHAEIEDIQCIHPDIFSIEGQVKKRNLTVLFNLTILHSLQKIPVFNRLEQIMGTVEREGMVHIVLTGCQKYQLTIWVLAPENLSGLNACNPTHIDIGKDNIEPAALQGMDEFLTADKDGQGMDDVLFFKWPAKEIKRGSRLILRPGQKAVFYRDGMVGGIFEEQGNFDIETDIVPFLSTLKGWFQLRGDAGMRAEVYFVNAKELLLPWGTRQRIMGELNPVVAEAILGGESRIGLNGLISLQQNSRKMVEGKFCSDCGSQTV